MCDTGWNCQIAEELGPRRSLTAEAKAGTENNGYRSAEALRHAEPQSRFFSNLFSR
jgi:hypothetical protein